MITFYTDGSCSMNPGPGGCSVVGLNDNKEIDYCWVSYSDSTTNNREELKAILFVLKHFGNPEKPVPTVYSDSGYAVNTYTKWMYNWARNGWIKSDKKVPENLDIIKEYYEYIQKGYSINLNQIRGHNGILGNEIADKLATARISVCQMVTDYGSPELKEKFNV